MNDQVNRSHPLIYDVSEVTWAASGATAVTLTVKGKTSTPGWTNLSLVPSTSHTSTPDERHFDATGTAPTGIVPQVITDVTFTHRAFAGVYTVIVHAANGEASVHVNYPLGDAP